MLQTLFQVIEGGLGEAKTTAVIHAREVADEEHHRIHTELRCQADGLNISVSEVKRTVRTLENLMQGAQVRLGAHQVQLRSTTTAIEYANPRALVPCRCVPDTPEPPVAGNCRPRCVSVPGLSYLDDYATPTRSRAVGDYRSPCFAASLTPVTILPLAVPASTHGAAVLLIFGLWSHPGNIGHRFLVPRVTRTSTSRCPPSCTTTKGF